MKTPGIIALDIDGTITNEVHQIPQVVIEYFESLHRQNWQFIFVTGRMFSFAEPTLKKLSFPYLLAVQNGADLLEMPHKKPVDQAYFGMDIVEKLDHLYEDLQDDFLLYSGYQKGDFCYYRPGRFSQPLLKYLEKLKPLSSAPWKALETFDLSEQTTFPLIKCVGFEHELEPTHAKLKDQKGIKTCMIQDPIDPAYTLLLINHQSANKGSAVATLKERFALEGPTIVAGDDHNDLPLFEAGDIKIAIGGSPQKLVERADIVAPPSRECGIIPGLKEAIQRVSTD